MNDYNLLMDVSDADIALKQHRYRDALEALGRVLVRNNLNRNIGVRLLHRHNDVGPEEIMLEVPELTADGANALATIRIKRSEQHEPIPGVWRCRPGGELEVLEFVDRCCLSNQEERILEEGKEAFRECGRIIDEFELSDLLGLCFINKPHLRFDRSIEAIVELIDEQRSANVVSIKPLSYLEGKTSVETTWQFDSNVTMQCIANCYSYCIEYSPGHAIKHHSWHSFPD